MPVPDAPTPSTPRDDATPRRTTIVGAGAVGSYYGAMLARAGEPVTLIARDAHVRAIAAHGLQLHHEGRVETVALDATTDPAAVRGADLVLVCVKSNDTEAVARQIAPHVAADAVVLSLQNGVDNAPAIARHVHATVAPAVVYVATEMPAPGVVVYHGGGRLVVGAPDAAGCDASARALRRAIERLADAGVPVEQVADVRPALWMKLLLNCAYNAASALTQAPYERMARLAPVRELQVAVAREVVAVALADGVALALDEAIAGIERIAQTMPAQRSSTAQDVARGRPTEIDHLNGFVVRRGAALGVATPVNQALHALVKLVEAGDRSG
ncbi:ketopantoate reductase family protein [Calidifontimicrobium sp. SYSU G02091]|uniref:ketopantoate reductase family protein n=1 Tax=Calidifontimicrobium sp. SYSU G02091 TaxID=2926421 RepID=UPI00217524FF|nr:2-dehydropantoate 2-reductase [Calidifontimicrobium sp. SYSU G02091]